MGLGQSLMSILALGLLGAVLLIMNTNTLDSGTTVETTEYIIMANSLGISQLERASGLAFDENTVTGNVASPAGLTATLGREFGETTENKFDDFDDYHGFNRWVTGDSIFFRSADYFIRDSVDYVTIAGNQVVPSVGRTYHKRLRVWVSSPYMRDTLQFSTVYSYWYFR